MNKFTIYLTVIWFAGLAACTPAPTEANASPETQDTIEVQATAILDSAYPADGPGAVAIITINNETVFLAGAGLADVETQTPITEKTVFRLASITKQFAAATLMLLVEDGLVDLDAPISTYLPDYPEPAASIPVRRILNHTSGIPSYTGLPGVMDEASTSRGMTTEQMIALFKDLPVDFEPGDQWSYNNSGYVLVGAVIEAATGKSWSDVVTDRIAGPLGLETLASGVTESEVALMALGYTGDDDAQERSQIIHMGFPHAAGALISDVQDLADWGNAFHDGKVVSAKSYAAMIAPTVLNSGEEQDYGFGLAVGELRGKPIIGHSGGIFGFSTNSLYMPDEDVFVAVLANSDSPATPPSVVMRKLAALAIGDPYRAFTEQAIDHASLEDVVGVYTSDEITLTLFLRDDKLYTLRQNWGESEVLSAGEDTFFYGSNFDWFTIDRSGADGPVILFQTDRQATPVALKWTGPVPDAVTVPVDVLETYLGAYTLSVPVTAMVAAAQGGLDEGITIQLSGQPPFLLEPVSATEFNIPSVGATVRFAPEEDEGMGLIINQSGQTITGERTGE